jgi:hypothetical protein
LRRNLGAAPGTRDALIALLEIMEEKMLNRFVLPAAAAALVGAAALAPTPASAYWASTPASVTHGNAQSVSDVVPVHRRDRRRSWVRHHWRIAPYYYAPYVYAPRRCGYVWDYRLYRNVWRCW